MSNIFDEAKQSLTELLIYIDVRARIGSDKYDKDIDKDIEEIHQALEIGKAFERYSVLTVDELKLKNVVIEKLKGRVKQLEQLAKLYRTTVFEMATDETVSKVDFEPILKLEKELGL